MRSKKIICASRCDFSFRARTIFSPIHAPIPRQDGLENFFRKTVISHRLARRNRSKSSESVKVIRFVRTARTKKTSPRTRFRSQSSSAIRIFSRCDPSRDRWHALEAEIFVDLARRRMNLRPGGVEEALSAASRRAHARIFAAIDHANGRDVSV